MSKPKIGIITSTTRANRWGEKPARWFLGVAQKRDDIEAEFVDLRDYPMPLFDEQLAPIYAPPKNEAAQRWCAKLAELDGFVFVTAEYNHSVPAALKNAIDHAYKEFIRKPAGFVGYGGVGGARAIEHLRQIMVEMQSAPMRNGVYIALADFRVLIMGEKTFDDLPHLEATAVQVLDELAWWAKALKTARDAG